MSSVVIAALAAAGAAVIASFGPAALARVPEPVDPADGKRPYLEVARIGGAVWWMVVPAAVCAAAVGWWTSPSEMVPAWVVLCGVGAWLAFVDWHTHYLPVLLTSPLYVATWALVGLAALLLHEPRVLVRALIANVVVYVAFRVIHEIAHRFAGGAFGYGDVRLSAVLGAALGPLGREATLVGLYAGFVLGAVLGLVLQRLKVVPRGEIAFGPYLLLGAVVGAVWGPALHGG